MMHATPHANSLQHVVAQHVQGTDCFDFYDLLTSPELMDCLTEGQPEHRERLYPPTVTLSLFMAQALSSDGSCQNAVDGYVVGRMAQGLSPCSTATGAYCKARQSLPLAWIRALTRETGQLIEQATPEHWRWRVRPIKLLDGTTVSLPDTPENQARYPQQSGQRTGLGFPIARIVGIMSLASGAVLNAAIGPFKGKGTGESALYRQMVGGLESGDIVLADRYFGSYWFIADMLAQGIDVVLGQHGARKCDFRKGQRLGTRDHVVTWNKPTQRPEWMTPEQYVAYPATVSVRECRARKKILVATFLSNKAVPKSELAWLYEQRWQVELDLRNLKTTLGMERLRCQTPDMTEKEIWVYFLAYDLIRLLMCQAAVQAGILPCTISYKHTLQFWLAWIRYPVDTFDQEQLRVLFLLIAQRRVGNRPGRIEPRAVKRRPKPHPLLMKPRAIAREHIRKHGHPRKLK